MAASVRETRATYK